MKCASPIPTEVMTAALFALRSRNLGYLQYGHAFRTKPDQGFLRGLYWEQLEHLGVDGSKQSHLTWLETNLAHFQDLQRTVVSHISWTRCTFLVIKLSRAKISKPKFPNENSQTFPTVSSQATASKLTFPSKGSKAKVFKRRRAKLHKRRETKFQANNPKWQFSSDSVQTVDPKWTFPSEGQQTVPSERT